MGMGPLLVWGCVRHLVAVTTTFLLAAGIEPNSGPPPLSSSQIRKRIAAWSVWNIDKIFDWAQLGKETEFQARVE